MTLSRMLAAAGAVHACACLAQPVAFTEDDRELLARRPVIQVTVDRAAALGQAESLEALDVIIASGNLDLLRMYAPGFRAAKKPTPEANAAMQRRIVSLWDKPWVGALLQAPRAIDDKRLTELVIADVVDLAKLRAQRRRECTIAVIALHRGQVAGDVPAYSAHALTRNPAPVAVEVAHETRLNSREIRKVDWRMACPRPNPAEPMTDLDGMPRIEIVVGQNPRITYVAPRRDLESVRAVTRVTAPGIAARLAPLLGYLWLPPSVSWDKVGKPKESIDFPPLQPPREILYFLRQQHVTPGTDVIAPILAAYEEQLPARWTSTDDSTDINALLDLAVEGGSAQGLQLVAHWLPLIAASPNQSSRDYMLSSFVWKIGAAPPGQVDLANVKREILGAVPYADVGKYSFMFDQAQRSRTPVNASPAAR